MAKRRPGPYVPLSVYYFDDPALMEAGEDAELMYVRMLAYAGRSPQNEGWIPHQVALTRLGISPRMVALTNHSLENVPENVPESVPEKRLERLQEVGLIRREGDGWQLVSWLRWNRSAEELHLDRSADRRRKQALTRESPENVPENVPESVPEKPLETVPNSRGQIREDTDKSSAKAADLAVGAASTAHQLVSDWIDTCRVRPPNRVVGQVAQLVDQLLDEGYHAGVVQRTLAAWQGKSLHPSTIPSVLHEITNGSVRRLPKQDEIDQGFTQLMERAREKDAQKGR